MAPRIKDVGDAPELWGLMPQRQGSVQLRGAFSNPESFARYLEERKSDAWDSYHFVCGRTDFYGATYTQAVDLSLNGWHAGADRVAQLREKIKAANPIGPRVVKWDVAGAVASVPRALSGNPTSMRRVDTTRLRRRPVMTLVSHCGAIARVDTESFIRRAAVVAAIVDQVEAAGFSCHVVAYSVSTGSGVDAQHAVTLKESSSPVDVARLAFGLGHTAMFRRLVFGFYASDEVTKPFGGSMGRTEYDVTVDASNSVFLFPSVQSCERYFMDDTTAATSGLAHMVAQLAAQGCPAFPTEQAA